MKKTALMFLLFLIIILCFKMLMPKSSLTTSGIHLQTAIRQNDAKVTLKKINPISQVVSIDTLAGEVDPKSGVRRDILKYIQDSIPGDNPSARKAAITLSATEQKIYYLSSRAEALKLIKLEFLALSCLMYSLPNFEWRKITKKMDSLMRNTPERDKHLWEIDEKYFGWHILESNTLSSNKLKEFCEKGDY